MKMEDGLPDLLTNLASRGYIRAVATNRTDTMERYVEDQSTTHERYLRAWRRNLELSYITLAGAYALQVVDAYVDAHLFYWDVSPELTLRVEPSIRPHLVPVGGPVTNYGLKCSLSF
jgi:hypothetical protein